MVIAGLSMLEAHSSSLSAQSLAWRPFLDPLNAHGAWWAFLIPLAFLIALTYRAVRLPEPGGILYWRQVLVMTVQIVAAMILLGVAAFLFIEHLLPLLVPMRW